MILSNEQKALMQQAISAVRQLNDSLKALRESGIACNIRDTAGPWMLDAKAIIKVEHYQ